MNLSKQQLDAVAREIFKQIQSVVDKEKEEVSKSLLKNTKLKTLKKAFDQYDASRKQMYEFSDKISQIKHELGIGNEYISGYDYESQEKSFINTNVKNLNPYKIEDIKDFILLASIEETDLAAIINAVTKKIMTNNE